MFAKRNFCTIDCCSMPLRPCSNQELYANDCTRSHCHMYSRTRCCDQPVWSDRLNRTASSNRCCFGTGCGHGYTTARCRRHGSGCWDETRSCNEEGRTVCCYKGTGRNLCREDDARWIRKRPHQRRRGKPWQARDTRDSTVGGHGATL